MEPFVRFFRCPRCAAAFSRHGSALRCAAGHTFDLARQGYVHLAPDSRLLRNADSLAMVDARDRFLRAGHFRPLTLAIAEVAADLLRMAEPGLCVLDAGAGPGHYLAGVLSAAPDRVGLALDLSKAAARRAARAHPRIAAAVADLTLPLPVKSGCATLALNVFAPRPAEELHRVLAPGGALVVVTPTGRHLRELIDRLGLLHVDARKDQRLRERMSRRFEPIGERTVEHPLRLGREDALSLIGMGPNAFHLDPEALRARLAGQEEVTASFQLRVFRRMGER